ncbi:MAG: ATP-binding cassette domain-containing protein [Actinobacteria bacterium]|nr:ATP-binding cassette domain-containing protein [Actinomycetota bacterium]
MTLAISVTGLRKSFGDTLVLDGIDLAVPEGSVFSLLGPNGAGKTTTVQILSTLLPADAGRIEVAGHDLATAAARIRAAIGVTGQFSAIDPLLTGAENLRLMAELNHLPRPQRAARVTGLLEQFGLTEAARRPASTYSGGMQRRLDLAMTLTGNPRLIFLDEPTTGLDPRSRRDMWQHIRGLVAGGVTIFLTTQYLDEADELADQIAVLDHGRIVAAGRAAELKRQIPGGHVQLQFATAAGLDTAAGLLGGATRDDDALTLRVAGGDDAGSVRALLNRLHDAGADADRVSVHSPSLDDVFFAFTGTGPSGPQPTEEVATR